MRKKHSRGKAMAKKDSTLATTISILRHNSIMKHLSEQHDEEVMKLRDTIVEIKRRPSKTAKQLTHCY